MQFLKTTIVGGIVFLLPITILVVILGKALILTRKLAAPFSDILPFGRAGDVIAINLLGLAFIVLLCFFGGLIARSKTVSRLIDALETRFLTKIPLYSLVRGTVSNTLRSDNADGMIAVVVRFDDYWQLAFEVERTDNGVVTVFLPGSPDPWSGSVCFVNEGRVMHIDTKLLKVMGVLNGFGKGSNRFLPT